MWLRAALCARGLVLNSLIIGAASGALWFAAPAKAGFVNLSGNWQASWDPSLDGLVSITEVGFSNNNIFITKSATFTQGPTGSGLFPTIPIAFTQLGASTVQHIVIESETITNNTGVAWNGFRMDLLGNSTTFNPTLTLASGGPAPIGFAISPFTTASFSNANAELDIAGGTVNNGGVWTPGSGAKGGQLWINVTSQPSAPFGFFTLKETPMPAPGTVALLGLAGLIGFMRRRR